MYMLHKIKHFWACYLYSTTYILSYKIYRRKYLLLKWCLCCHENIIIRGKIIIDCILYNKILIFKTVRKCTYYLVEMFSFWQYIIWNHFMNMYFSCYINNCLFRFQIAKRYKKCYQFLCIFSNLLRRDP